LTVAEALALGTARLREAGVDAPAHDAEVLLRYVLGWDRARLLTDASAPLPADQEATYRRHVGERAARRPLQHLTGRQWFWRHEFRVSGDALIPRPETEILVEAALGRLEAVPRPRIVDVGTGSGCIALSLAAERPDAVVTAIDVSPAALGVAAENARALGLADRVRLLEGDLLEPVRSSAGSFDLVASNPPYVDPGDAASLSPEVREHEPALALFPPGEPCSVYRRLAPQAVEALRPGGWLLLEIGQGMEPEVVRICAAAGFRVEPTIADLQGIPRTVVAIRP
jgi:release factor glutamine methyltransferase